MQYIAFVLSLYFAANLSVAAITKIEQPSTFATVLRRNDVIPEWSIGGICRYFPWVEIAVAGLLVTGILPTITAMITGALFTGFLVVKSRMLVTKRVNDCGCFGSASTKRVDSTAVVSAMLLVLLAVCYLLLVIAAGVVAWQWRVGASIIFSSAEIWLGWLAWKRYKRNSQCRVWAAAGGCTAMGVLKPIQVAQPD